MKTIIHIYWYNNGAFCATGIEICVRYTPCPKSQCVRCKNIAKRDFMIPLCVCVEGGIGLGDCYKA